MSKPRNLFLIGPMGAGKSAVGRQLARLLHMDFVDSDEEIESRTGVDIPFIFEKEGEEGFRKREAKVIDELTARQGTVLATGGGASQLGENVPPPPPLGYRLKNWIHAIPPSPKIAPYDVIFRRSRFSVYFPSDNC